MKIVFSYFYMQPVVDAALELLREKSPVGSVGDKHPGLYRDNHLVFLNGSVVQDVNNWQPGQQINISNPVPYSRKIEAGRMKMSVPAHVYEDTAQILANRFGNSVNVKFVFMPVRFGDIEAYAAFSKQIRPGRKLSAKARRDWLVRQPALQITAR